MCLSLTLWFSALTLSQDGSIQMIPTGDDLSAISTAECPSSSGTTLLEIEDASISPFTEDKVDAFEAVRGL